MRSAKLLSAGIVLLAGALGLYGQAPQSPAAATAELTQAYKALNEKDYDSAISLFRKALAIDPNNPGVHKDLAYTLLKAGENEDARDEFEAALKLTPGDETAALEYAFLAFETKKPIEARRMFDRLRQRGSATTRKTAEQAFENIDAPLATGIERWKQALARSANPSDITMFSAHWELAQLAELRDDLPLAAEQYEICRNLKPQMSELLLILARVWRQLNRMEDARAALLAASRSNDSRTAELAFEQMDRRYPYPYEFVGALKLDPGNGVLRRELGFLYLAMHQNNDAIQQFQQALAANPQDQLSRDQLDALRGFKRRPDAATTANAIPAQASAQGVANHVDAKAMGEKSLALGYSRDAIKYLRQAHEENPDDAEVMLKLGWAYNLAKEDAEAKMWFDRARHAADPEIAAEANKAFHALNGDMPAQTTVWFLPMYSSRWGDLFGYGQVKRSFLTPWDSLNRWVSFYVSVRFDGDVKRQIATPFGPGYLSTDSFTVAAGVSSKTWHHLTGWWEAGEGLRYLFHAPNTPLAIPDYRGGLNFAKGFGSLLGSKTSGFFYETTADAIYISRFDKDWFVYWQNRTGHTFKVPGNNSLQLLFNANYGQDVKDQYWADTAEMGPGAKLHFGWMPPGMYFGGDFLRGVYLNNKYNPRGPNYNDIRLSVWFAKTKNVQ